VAGAVVGTAGLALLIYGFVQTAEKGHGWGTGLTAGTLIGAVVLLAGFLFIESKARSPLMPLRLFKLRGVAGANLVGFLLGCAIFAMFYFLSRYMGEVQHLGPKEIGVRYLLVALTIVVAAGVSQGLVTKVGVRPVLTVGMTLLAAGLLYFTFIRVNGGYARDLVPGFILSGIGLGFSFIPVAIGALEGVGPADAGVASGIVNTAQQVGGAVGLGLLGSIANVGTDRYISDKKLPAGGFPPAEALVQGYHWAFWVGVALSALGIVASLVMIKGGKLQDGVAAAH
jgi:predicted MFS family arabinose efflux permease